MGSPQKANQSTSEEKVSKSRKVVEAISRVIDWVSWLIIGVLVYFWLQTRGATTDCKVETCQQLYRGICDFGVTSINITIENFSDLAQPLVVKVIQPLITMGGLI